MTPRNALRCPRCNSATEVKRTSLASNGTIRRERACLGCSLLVVTSERVVKQRERAERRKVWPLGDQLDAPFGVLGSTLTRVPRKSRGREASAERRRAEA